MQRETYGTLSQATKALREKGFTDSFEWTEKGLKDLENEKVYQAGDLKIVGLHRFEGMSNPSDMSVLYAITCEDGRKGTVISAYGTYGNEDLLQFLEGVERDLPYE